MGSIVTATGSAARADDSDRESHLFRSPTFHVTERHVAIPITLGILAFMLLWDSKRQQIWDKVAGTVIVDGLAY
jgi:hypothetical protein